ncbi:MAG: type IX secretion system membrane protein PorP/SprF, partial [Cytophagales bacterium]|nr:type IX secretion system membrane protein PorP/SprF [Cytophagales bacterium]
MRRLLLVCLCSIVTLLSAWAQDPQYSQFYANPLYLSPAFAGSSLAPRVGVNYRNQWPALDATFVTYSASFDYYFPRVNSGVGIIINRDQQFAKLNSTDVGAQYAYQLQLGERVALRTGVQLSFATRSVNFLDLNFGDQFTNEGLQSLITSDPALLDAANISYFDFSSGGLLYSDRAWLGVSGHHLNRPTQSFIDQDSRLPIRMTVHAGYKFPLDDETRQGLAMNVLDREKSLSFAALYKGQGKFDQFDVGTYLTYEPVVFGLWYRG